MIKHGKPPYLECSSRGARKFSALYARLKHYSYMSIEELYQREKIIGGVSGLSIKEAKGKKAENQEHCSKFYSQLWDLYIQENPEYLIILKEASGLSDMFGQPGYCCQATELWRIRNASL